MLATAGLPAHGNHGGAQTCMGIIKGWLSAGHHVSVLSLFDVTAKNPYVQFRQNNEDLLNSIGVTVFYVYYNETLFTQQKCRRRHWAYLSSLIGEDMAIAYPWVQLREPVQALVASIKPDAIFCYHFEPLAALYQFQLVPKMAGVGDPTHKPTEAVKQCTKNYFSLQYAKLFCVSLLDKALYIPRMKKLMQDCQSYGAFAGHYAHWFRQQGLSDCQYLRSPIADPLSPSTWLQKRLDARHNLVKPRILLMGDLTGTATRFGLELFAEYCLPLLEKQLGTDAFEVHIVGGGALPTCLASFQHKPYLKLRGRIEPCDHEFLKADVLCVPTPVDLGIRVRILTAFSFGCPVVAHQANSAGIPEMADGVNCLLADSGDQLANKILQVIQNSELNNQLSRKGRSLFESTFLDQQATQQITQKMESTLTA